MDTRVARQIRVFGQTYEGFDLVLNEDQRLIQFCVDKHEVSLLVLLAVY